MSQEHVFGSGDLTPELVRSVRFESQDGRVDAAEVHQFLDRVASALEVFLSGDSQVALRREFARNAEIAQQVLDAGQTASDHLRGQAAQEALELLQDSQRAADALVAEATADAAGVRDSVEQQRTRMVQDLRDLYDRIGASLYRFEREEPAAAAATATAPAPAPVAAPAHEPVFAPIEPAFHTEGSDEPVFEAAFTEPQSTPAAEPEQLAPAWTQLPTEAYASPEAAPAAGSDPFDVVEDEPLQPGEPLVDLRDFAATDEPAAATPTVTDDSDGDLGGSWLETPPSAPAAQPAPVADAGGSWLDDPEVVEYDDLRAQALIAGLEVDPDEPPAAPTPGSLEPAGGASPDALAVRQLILDSLAAGQSRESIETYLRETMGLVEPGALIDAALNAPG